MVAPLLPPQLGCCPTRNQSSSYSLQDSSSLPPQLVLRFLVLDHTIRKRNHSAEANIEFSLIPLQKLSPVLGLVSSLPTKKSPITRLRRRVNRYAEDSVIFPEFLYFFHIPFPFIYDHCIKYLLVQRHDSLRYLSTYLSPLIPMHNPY